MNTVSAAAGSLPRASLVRRATGMLARIPYSGIALLARFSIAAVFWSSGQTKVEGFALNFVSGEFQPGWPRLSDTAVALFRDEYRLPLAGARGLPRPWPLWRSTHSRC
jgi:putative oxidoreductase